MVDVDKAQIAKIRKNGQNFEILVDSNLAIALKGKGNVNINDVLAAEKIFADAKKGMESSPIALKQAFGTDDVFEVAKEIIIKGDVPLTAEYRQELRETKKKQIINMIHRNAVDPQTHLPHPPARVEAAMDEAKVHIDEFEDVNRQMQEVLKKIRIILPIKFEVKEIAVKISPEYAAKSYQVLNQFGKKLKEEWLNDGSLSVVLEMPGGLEEDFYEKINALCHGNVESKVLKTK